MLESFVVKDFANNQVQCQSNIHFTNLLSGQLHPQPAQQTVSSIDIPAANQDRIPQMSEPVQQFASSIIPESLPGTNAAELHTHSLDSAPVSIESNAANSTYVISTLPTTLPPNSDQAVPPMMVPQNSNSVSITPLLGEYSATRYVSLPVASVISSAIAPQNTESSPPMSVINNRVNVKSQSKECQTISQNYVSVGVNTEETSFVISVKAESYDTRGTDQKHVTEKDSVENIKDSESNKTKAKKLDATKAKVINTLSNKRNQIKRKRGFSKDNDYVPPKKGHVLNKEEKVREIKREINEVNETHNSKPIAKRKAGQIEFKKYNPKKRLPPAPRDNDKFVEVIKASNQKDYYCALCPDSPRFTEEIEYVCHVKDVHMKRAEIGFMFPCLQCDRTFTLQHERHKHKWRKFLGGLFHHLITQHAMEWPDFMDVYKCKKCGVYISPRSQNVYIHLTRCGVNENEIKRTVCLHCGKQYVSAGSHMKYCNKR